MGVRHLDGDGTVVARSVTDSPRVLVHLDELSDVAVLVDIEVGGSRTRTPDAEDAFVGDADAGVVMQSDGCLLVRGVRDVTGLAELGYEVLDGLVVVDGESHDVLSRPEFCVARFTINQRLRKKARIAVVNGVVRVVSYRNKKLRIENAWIA